MPSQADTKNADEDASSKCSHMWIGGLVVACLFIGYLLVKKQSSGMMGNFVPWVSGSDLMPDSMPSLTVLRRCTKCEYTLTGKMCPNCGSCPNCRSDDKCGECQQFPRQISLSERSRPCPACGHKPCTCPSATGKKVEHEPGVARNGVFSDIVTTSF